MPSVLSLQHEPPQTRTSTVKQNNSGSQTKVTIGLTVAKLWTRKKFKGSWALRRDVNPTRVPIDARRSIDGLKTYVNLWRC